MKRDMSVNQLGLFRDLTLKGKRVGDGIAIAYPTALRWLNRRYSTLRVRAKALCPGSVSLTGECGLCTILASVQEHRMGRSGGMGDALRSGRSGHFARVGSNPTFGTLFMPRRFGTWALLFK